MSTDISKNKLKAYEKDSRIVCRYGMKCYQKNPAHHEKYKHPPTIERESSREERTMKQGMKRRMEDCADDDESYESDELQSKYRKADVSSRVTDAHCMSPSPSESTGEDDSENLTHKNSDEKVCNDEQGDEAKKAVDTSSASSVDEKKTTTTSDSSSKLLINLNDAKEIISKIFLVNMPEDFYEFYDFCTLISNKDPSSALKIVDLKLVGPFDILNGMIQRIPQNDADKDKYLRHWRYFYDPPEFQTILKGNDKEGLHYGYWRDECNEKPIFVAKNSANTSCKIISVASNIFGAVKFHIDERLKVASVFDKSKIARILKMLITFVKDHGIIIERYSNEMRDRERKVVAKSFHGAGIVVPYDKKTQVGYRVLAATDSHLQKILDKIDKAENEEIRMKYMSEIEEVVRMAAIAADECDFGTPLELAHDLFSSGIESTQRTMLHMFSMAYGLLNRTQFVKIAVAHMKDRKKGCDLSVI